LRLWKSSPRLRGAPSSLDDLSDGVLESSGVGVTLLISWERRDISLSSRKILDSEEAPVSVGEGARLLKWAGLQIDPVLTQFEHAG